MDKLLIKDLRKCMFADVKIVSENQCCGYLIHFEGDLSDTDVDPQVLEMEVEIIQAASIGHIRIIVKK